MLRKRIGLSLAVVAILVGMFAFSSPMASAHGRPTGTRWPTKSTRSLATTATSIGCYESSCDHKDPISMGCTGDAYLQEQDTGVWGYIQNWWSASCNTNWTVAQANSGYWVYETGISNCPNGNITPPSSSCPTGDSETILYSTQADAYGGNCVYYQAWDVCGNGVGENTTHWYTNMYYAPNGSLSFATFAYTNSTTPLAQPGTDNLQNSEWH